MMSENIIGTRYGLDMIDNETDWSVIKPTEIIITDTDEDEPIKEKI